MLESWTLGEGNTPLVRSRQIGPAAGLKHLYFKLESLNPTGSYKDRFAVAAVRDMLQRGVQRVVASSSGNAGAALAAYCAAAGITCQIAVVDDAPEGKLKQMLAYGAQLWKIRNFGLDPTLTGDVLQYLHELGKQPGSCLQISAFRHSPVGMAGVESISHELSQQTSNFENPLKHVFVCAGGGGLILAVARGFHSLGHAARVHCVQPAGNDTIAGPLRRGSPTAQKCDRSTTRLTGLQVPNVIDGNESLLACRASGGTGFLVEDDEVTELQARLAREEGIFCEPAAAAPLAGALQAAREGLISSDDVTVCLVTGAGFKDPAAIDRMVSGQSCPLVTFDEFQKQTTRHSPIAQETHQESCPP
ncbi:pyridoxal-phosphate dependent enzyme [Planctomicrobium sp. SH661]|uniref:pyridoxal-phosphate dependent enzyme n=1 Tax=Planctomicrobium sp. SH661 TaxID=3448124 RepID=UPI003F5C023C